MSEIRNVPIGTSLVQRTCLACEGRGRIWDEHCCEYDDCPDCDGERSQVQCERCGEWMSRECYEYAVCCNVTEL